MNESAKAKFENLLVSEPSITEDERLAIRRIIREGGDRPERLMSRREVADLIGKTPQMVDVYARKGWLKRVYLGDASRASGFTTASVKAFVTGYLNMDAKEL